ncbi:urea carboxylase [Methylobacillus methanolivorans]|uniref:Urea carboxylase n=1 Tax=Methylobacillus methanolivorans TaxID=1848927 RepID=A0ABW8GJG1_9PROT
MFSTVLIANRGEIAVRAIRTLKKLGVKSVAVYSNPDRNAAHVQDADVAVALGGDKANESYLLIDKIIQAAKETGAEAIYPGYGFLSESADFAERCEAEGIAFIGPTPEQIREFGLKHRARELAAEANVPMAPGSGLLATLEEALTTAEGIGYPVMLKSTAGGGGIGLTRCDSEEDLRNAYDSVKRMGEQFFSDSGVFLERFVDQARHVEVQLFGDGLGNVAALGERDCSLQRRNQKVVEETPAPNLPEATRKAMHQAAVELGKLVKYRSAGTVEFIYDHKRDEFYFLEVNTRLQVEHPVTEMVTGLDLIECMLKVAAGDTDSLDWERMHSAPQGCAIEVRIYAEDPLRNFQPSPGVLTEVYFPDDARIDGWISTGTEVSAFYDPMIAKLIVHGSDRAAAIKKMETALAHTRLHGISTNLQYLRQIITSPEFNQASFWTRFLDHYQFVPAVIEVLEPGTYTSVQDYPGRLGYWSIGVPPSGPMDDYAFRLANRIVGNHESAAGLECTLQGPSLKFHQDAVIALTGADCPATLDDEFVAYWQPINVKAGQVLKVGRAASGCRTYVAIRNGIDVPLYLGSRSTFALGQFGGHAGRTLRPADMLQIADPALPASTTPAPISLPQAMSSDLIPHYGTTWNIGVLYGPHGAPDFFTLESIDAFFDAEWEVHYNSNRLGIRLTGPKPSWTRTDGGEAGLHPSNVHDCEYAIGSINFTGDFPVILTRDGPSLGGFVCPVTIAKAELWKVGQVKPGDKIRFHPISFDEAQALEQAQLSTLETLCEQATPAHTGYSLLPSDTSSATILAELPEEGYRPSVTYRQAGDAYILLEYGDNVLDLALRLRVHLLMEAINKAQITGLEELAPGVRSLQIRYDSNKILQNDLIQRLLALEAQLPDANNIKIPNRVVYLPMAFEDSATLGAVQRYQETVKSKAPWLPNNVDFIQRINGLSSRDEVRDIIFDASYMILGLGDVYLDAPCAVPLDPRHRLLTSKYNPARTFTAEGTVGIGGVYMCIYGMDSPGGYQLVGRTLPIWNKYVKNAQFKDGKPWLLHFFDEVRFYPVSEDELTKLREEFREGRAEIRIEESTFDYAAYLDFIERNQDSIATFQAKQKSAFDAEVALWQNSEEDEQQADIALEQDDIDDTLHKVLANLNGNVWKILVEPGQTVEIGDTLMIVEAMKMEMTVQASVAGRVHHVRSKVGHIVSPGDMLVLIDPQ